MFIKNDEEIKEIENVIINEIDKNDDYNNNIVLKQKLYELLEATLLDYDCFINRHQYLIEIINNKDYIAFFKKHHVKDEYHLFCEKIN